jgi:ComF family protein
LTLARRLVTHALDALFPPKCVGCGDFGAFICDRCLETAPRAAGNRCPRCWSTLEDFSCPNCKHHAVAFTAMRSAFSYGGVAREAVLSLKFHGVSALAPRMASQMTTALREWSPPVDVIVPVPLGWLRRRTRGYNQSGLLASEIARACGLRVEHQALRRTRRTAPQSRQPDAARRRENVRGAFGPGARPVSGNILLVDDVSTTGATLDACAQALLTSGATNVYALTFARED